MLLFASVAEVRGGIAGVRRENLNNSLRDSAVLCEPLRSLVFIVN